MYGMTHNETASIVSLTEKEASDVIRRKPPGPMLCLDGLLDLSPPVAAVLNRHIGPLRLCGLTTLSVETARELAKHRGSLVLDGVSTISPDVARELGKAHRAELSLGLTDLPPEVARNLSRTRGSLSLKSLKAISDRSAVEIAKKRAGHLSLSGLTAITPDIAEALAGCQAKIYMQGLVDISQEVANKLARQRDGLRSSEQAKCPRVVAAPSDSGSLLPLALVLVVAMLLIGGCFLVMPPQNPDWRNDPRYDNYDFPIAPDGGGYGRPVPP